jgi:transposase
MAEAYTIEQRRQIVNAVRQDGLTGVEASKKYDVHIKTVYRWLKEDVTDVNVWELNRLKRENEQLYTILGKVTAELKRSKS